MGDKEIYRRGYKDGYKKREAAIIRCRDCKYYGKTMGSCAKLDGYDYMPDFYCACAERKDN